MRGHHFQRWPKRRPGKPGHQFGSFKAKKLQKAFSMIEAAFQGFSPDEQADMVQVGGPMIYIG